MGNGESFPLKVFIVCTVHKYSQGDENQKIEKGMAIARMDEVRDAFKILTDEPRRKGPLRLPWHK